MARSRKRRQRRGGRPRPQASAPKRKAAVEPPVRRTARGERPAAPWGSFPLTELTVLVGLIMLVAGLFSGGNRGFVMIGVGTVLGALGGLEVSIREHFAGYRSHSALLALACGVLTSVLLAVLAALVLGTVVLAIPLAAGVVAFAAAFMALRGAFRRASGGLSFRVGGLRG
jgi:hypothetical protein